MSSRKQQDASEPYSPLQVRLHLASVIILVAGLIGAAVIYVTAPEPDSAELIYGATSNPQYQLGLRRIGGTAEVVMAEFHQWFDSLWHGKPLAYTVAVLCAAVAGACFMAGHSRFFEPLHEPADHHDS